MVIETAMRFVGQEISPTEKVQNILDIIKNLVKLNFHKRLNFTSIVIPRSSLSYGPPKRFTDSYESIQRYL